MAFNFSIEETRPHLESSDVRNNTSSSVDEQYKLPKPIIQRPVEEDPNSNRIFVGGLSWQTTPEKLKYYFQHFGTIKDSLIKENGGYGFITFNDPCSVKKVLCFPNHILDGNKIYPKPPFPLKNLNTQIYVGGVSQTTSAEELKSFFSLIGEVEEAVLVMDRGTNRHRGFAFVTFKCKNVSEYVCHTRFYIINNKRVECKKVNHV